MTPACSGEGEPAIDVPHGHPRHRMADGTQIADCLIHIPPGASTMARPDPQRKGSEQDQRRHSGNDSEASDAGVQDKSQGKSGTASPLRKDDPSRAPESGDKPEADPRREGV
jgi:hypothetical protein